MRKPNIKIHLLPSIGRFLFLLLLLLPLHSKSARSIASSLPIPGACMEEDDPLSATGIRIKKGDIPPLLTATLNVEDPVDGFSPYSHIWIDLPCQENEQKILLFDRSTASALPFHTKFSRAESLCSVEIIPESPLPQSHTILFAILATDGQTNEAPGGCDKDRESNLKTLSSLANIASPDVLLIDSFHVRSRGSMNRRMLHLRQRVIRSMERLGEIRLQSPTTEKKGKTDIIRYSGEVVIPSICKDVRHCRLPTDQNGLLAPDETPYHLPISLIFPGNSHLSGSILLLHQCRWIDDNRQHQVPPTLLQLASSTGSVLAMIENDICSSLQSSNISVDSIAVQHLREFLFSSLLKSHISRLIESKNGSGPTEITLFYVSDQPETTLFAINFNTYLNAAIILFSGYESSFFCRGLNNENRSPNPQGLATISQEKEKKELEFSRIYTESALIPVCPVEENAYRKISVSKPLFYLHADDPPSLKEAGEFIKNHLRHGLRMNRR